MASPVELFRNITSVWSVIADPENESIAIEDYIAQLKALEKFGQSRLNLHVFSYPDFRIRYVSPVAAENFGMTIEEVMDKGPGNIFQLHGEPQRKFASEQANWFVNLLSDPNTTRLLNTNVYYCNWQINPTSRSRKQVLMHVFPVMVSQLGKPLLGMNIMHDVKPFVEPDIWWVRAHIQDEVFTYHPDNGTFEQGELFSAREMDVLKMLEQGNTSKEIADQLHLSSATVDNHRRRMLKRSGARDTTALVHLSKMTCII